MAIFKCKICGGTLEITEGSTICVCEYCGTKQTLPRLDNERKINMYDRADHFRRNNDYDKAMSIYESILNEDATDAEAYWLTLLCRFGVEYVKDPITSKHIPTINRAQFTSVLADEDYKSAISYADSNQKELYEQEAKYIDEIQKGILEISQKEEPYDVFICYKETDANGRRTHDSVLAADLYHGLVDEGFKVFFSRITLEDKLGTAYEPYIFAALNSAKVMVVIGTKPEFFNAVWVKNEWSRYLAMIKSGAKKTLIPAYRDMDPYDLPDEFSHLQAQDMSKLGFMQDLIRGIKKLASTEQKTTNTKETIVINGQTANFAPLLKRAKMSLEDGEWEKAEELCEQVLNQDPECAEAYLCKLLGEFCANTKEQLNECEKPFDENANYKKILRFGDNKLISELQGYLSEIKERNAMQAENKRKEALYQKAMDLFSFNNIDILKEAIAVFNSIADWKDSSEKINIYQERIESIKIKTEQDRIAKIREAELRKIKEEENAKKRKKTAKVMLSIFAIAVVFVIILSTVILPSINYNKGIEYLEAGDWQNAYKSFDKAGNWKDAQEKCNEIFPDDFGYSFEGNEVVITDYVGEEESITIPNGVTSIENYAFSDCKGLTSITIPNSVTSIGDSAFEGCTELTSMTLPFVGGSIDGTTNTHFGYIFGAETYSDNEEVIPSSLKTVIVTGCTSIGYRAFYGCSGLTSITIPNSLTSIGNCAFDGCTGLTSITIPNSVTSIGYRAFYGCSGLTSITIPNSLTSIGNCAFDGCTGLTNITIPNSVTTIGSYAFYGCTGLTSITIPNSVTSIGSSAFECCSGLTSITIPNSVTSIGSYAFSDCTGLTSITIPNSVTSIGNYAFEGCMGLTSITIPNSVTSIGGGAFSGCTGLTSITIPNSVTSIGGYAFYGCTRLTSITISNSVTSIGNYAFEGCTGLTTINYDGTKSQWNSIKKGSNWNYNTGNYTIYCTDGTISK